MMSYQKSNQESTLNTSSPYVYGGFKEIIESYRAEVVNLALLATPGLLLC